MPVHIDQPDHLQSPGKADLSGTQHYSETDRIFYHDGYQLAKEYLGKYFTYENMLMISSVLYDAVDSLTDSFLKRCRI
jgi:hypothetical protein